MASKSAPSPRGPGTMSRVPSSAVEIRRSSSTCQSLPTARQSQLKTPSHKLIALSRSAELSFRPCSRLAGWRAATGRDASSARRGRWPVGRRASRGDRHDGIDSASPGGQVGVLENSTANSGTPIAACSCGSLGITSDEPKPAAQIRPGFSQEANMPQAAAGPALRSAPPAITRARRAGAGRDQRQHGSWDQLSLVRDIHRDTRLLPDDDGPARPARDQGSGRRCSVPARTSRARDVTDPTTPSPSPRSCATGS